MRKLRSFVLIAGLAIAGLAGPARGAGPAVTVKAGLFFPSDKIFREVYSGGPYFGADVTVPITGTLQLWAGVDVFNKKGIIPVSEEKTEVLIVPLYAGLRARFGLKGLRPYIGAAAAYFVFHEKNPLGTANDGGLGFLSQAGVQARLGGAFWLDLFAGYRACTVRSDGDDPLEAKLGGFSLGLGLSYRF